MLVLGHWFLVILALAVYTTIAAIISSGQVFTLQLRYLAQWPKVLNDSLASIDPELMDIIEKEKNRQFKVGVTAVSPRASCCLPTGPEIVQTRCSTA
jgi:hypothetical protein